MNISNICLVPVEELTPLLLKDLPAIAAEVEASIVLVIFIVALVLNSFVGTIILINKHLHIRPFILSLQILIINVLQSLTRGPVVFVSGFSQSWLLGKYGCQIVGLTLLLMVTCRWLTMFTITLDRFLSVFVPFKYPKVANWVVVVLSLTFWICSLLYSLVPLTGFDCYTFSAETLVCFLQQVCPNAFCYLYYLATFSCLFLLGGIVPICMYIIMLYRAWKLRRSVTLGQLDSEQHQNQMTKSDVRAIITFFALFVALVGLSLPLYVSLSINLVISYFSPGMDGKPHVGVSYLLYDIYYLLQIADALILSWNRDIKKAIKNAMKRCIHTCHNNVQPVNMTALQATVVTSYSAKSE